MARLLCGIRVEFHHPSLLCHTATTNQGRIEIEQPSFAWKLEKKLLGFRFFKWFWPIHFNF